ncbi:DUF305 domain-containing protein [Lentzea tibetensis]|uniref:DUF305 domain-containing protein n=1 Tax=Lentzea tibetensis TaxID=2591470 RepID=A0A563EYE5_9PSEU|nr:DUF305 domain-containing protein [Lentzea tibetensis]TWP52643.1 DUF305 domain-containing protein [Lentzea tibetensis]
MKILRTALIGVAVLAALTACGSPATHNSADVKFAQEMVPHHEQALTMAKLVESRTENTHVIELASRIEKGQQPEIDKLNGKLKEWGSPASHSDHGGHGMVDTSTLTALKGTEFDRQWLALMITHHRGAVQSARDQQAKGTDPDTKKLAGDIITAQEKEIAEMESLLPQG